MHQTEYVTTLRSASLSSKELRTSLVVNIGDRTEEGFLTYDKSFAMFATDEFLLTNAKRNPGPLRSAKTKEFMLIVVLHVRT